MRTIAPEEVGPIERVGNMEWDPVRMMWKKDRVPSNSLKRDRTGVTVDASTVGGAAEGGVGADDEESDEAPKLKKNWRREKQTMKAASERVVNLPAIIATRGEG